MVVKGPILHFSFGLFRCVCLFLFFLYWHLCVQDIVSHGHSMKYAKNAGSGTMRSE